MIYRGRGRGGCFELSSLVLTKEYNHYKLKKMGDLKVGDTVLTIDPVENYKLKELKIQKYISIMNKNTNY